MRFNCHNQNAMPKAFTLVEVMIATAILGIMLSTILVSQMDLARKVADSHGRFIRLTVMKNMFFGPEFWEERKNKESASKTIVEPETKIKLDFIPGDKELKPFEDIFVERVQASWTGVFDVDDTAELGLISFLPEPQDKKKKS